MAFVCPDCLAELSAQQESCGSCGHVRPNEGWMPDPLTGLIVGGRYRLEGRLGAGGMASVFRASRIGALGGSVAVKVLAPRFSRTVIARRFEREAQVVARLTNPHIVRIYDFDRFGFVPDARGGQEQSLYYIAMELIEGQTLGQLLRAQGKVNFLWGIDVLRQMSRGLEEAHNQGIVHRDLKPSNVILVQQRGHTHIKILDFGIAALAARDDQPVPHEKLTQTGFVSGTPDYMAPEQAVGDPSIGPAADMFALGVIAFEMFSGRKPFEGATMESLLARVTKGAPSLREVMSDPSFPPELFRIVDKLLAREPSKRYQHAGELLDDLGRFPTLQTTPDFVPPRELLERYATSTSQPVFGAGAGEVGADGATPQNTSTAVARPAVRVPGARAGRRSSAWVWLLALLVLAGAGTAIALVITHAEPTTATPEVATSTPSIAPATTPPTAPAPPDKPTEPAIDAARVPAFLEGARPPLESGFMELRLTLGRDHLAIAEPAERPPLFRPLPLRIGLDRDGRPMHIVHGAITMALLRDGREVGRSSGRGRDDGRLPIDLPPRPLPDRFAVTLELTLGGDERVTAHLVYDARSGTFAPARDLAEPP